jgi:cystathionine gamma-synthase
MSKPKLSPETVAISAGRPSTIKDGSLNPDISLSSTYHAGGTIGYGRSGNQTWSALESAISELEGGQTLAFASGNAAISAAFALLPIGAPVVASDQGYSGTMAMLKSFQESGRLEVRFINLSRSLSMIMLYAFAAPAARVPPMIDAAVTTNPGSLPCAKTSAGTVVTSNNSTTRNFIKSKYPRPCSAAVNVLTVIDYSGKKSMPHRILKGMSNTVHLTKGADSDSSKEARMVPIS